MNAHRKHFWIMVACCLIPVVAFAAISIWQIPANAVLMFGLVLLCPLSHLLMMKYLWNGHNNKELPPAGTETSVIVAHEHK